MQIRMPESVHLAAANAFPTRCTGAALAQQSPGGPQGQALLPDARLPDEQGRLREPAGGKSATQPVEQGSMTINRS
jgi:hypothetical protein